MLLNIYDNLGWEDTSPSGSTSIATAGGNRALRMSGAAATCQTPRAVGIVSPPLSSTLPNPALRFRLRGSNPGGLSVTLRGAERQRQNFVIQSDWRLVTMCIAEANEGQAFELELELTSPNLCATNPAREVFVGSFSFESDEAACP
jgi:hypothetical protein